jgi:hypothetical protein
VTPDPDTATERPAEAPPSSLDDGAADTAPSETQPEEPTRVAPPSKKVPVLLVAGLVVLFLAMVTVAGLEWRRGNHLHGQVGRLTTQLQTERDVAATARGLADAVLSYDAAHLDQTQKHVDSFSTPDFSKYWQQSFLNSKTGEIIALQAVATANVKDVYVASVSGNDAKAVVVADFQVKSKTGTTNVSDTYLQLQLKRQSGQWKVNNLTLVIGPSQSQTPAPSPATPPTTAPAKAP